MSRIDFCQMAHQIGVCTTVIDQLLKENRLLQEQRAKDAREINALEETILEFLTTETPLGKHQRRMWFAMRGSSLTLVEMRVLSEIALCRSNQQIAERLGIAERTVRTHSICIYKKLGVRNRTSAALYAWRRGLVEIDEAWESVKSVQWGSASCVALSAGSGD